MKIPLGDILRKLLPSWKWLNVLKGISIKRGDTEILLNDRGGFNTGAGETDFDRTPHKPGPPPLGRR